MMRRRSPEELLTDLASTWEPKVRYSLAELADRYEPGLVSIIIPCYNNAPYVAEAIQSALDQTYQPCEVIVIDDGSTDGSWDIIQSFGDRIISRRRPSNGGACVARNDGLELASGKFIQFFDADDVLPHDSIEIRSQFYHPEIIHFGHCARFEDNPTTLKTDSEEIFKYQYINNDYADNNWVFMPTQSPLHHRKRVFDVGGFDEQLRSYQDMDLQVRLSLTGVGFRYVDHIACCLRKHESTQRISNNFTSYILERHSETIPRYAFYCMSGTQNLDEKLQKKMNMFRTFMLSYGRHALVLGLEEAARNYLVVAESIGAACLYQKQVSRILASILGLYNYEAAKIAVKHVLRSVASDNRTDGKELQT